MQAEDPKSSTRKPREEVLSHRTESHGRSPCPDPIVTIYVALLVTIAKSLFKEGCDVVYHTTQLLVTICLCSLEQAILS
jgi:hypothetical protein